MFIEFYSKIRRHSLQAFWGDCLHDKPEILELSYDDYFQTPEEKYEDGFPGDLSVIRGAEKEYFEDGLNSGMHEIDDYRLAEFLNLKRSLGTHDYIGQRVHQIASILRNLTFIDENIPTLTKNRSFIRFLVMLSNSRWGNLHHMGLDMLGNIALELDIYDPSADDLTRCLMSTICDGLEGPDRGVVISCLEILYKLCQKHSNEEFVHKSMTKKIYQQICLFLSLNDIMLLLYTLECIFSLTSTGEKACSMIVQINGVVDTLVALVTVEVSPLDSYLGDQKSDNFTFMQAQSYGPDGCILMRVVETVPSNATSTTLQTHSTNIMVMQNAIAPTPNVQQNEITGTTSLPISSINEIQSILT